MRIISITPATIAELVYSRTIVENELRKMSRVNNAFKAGREAFLRRGFSATDFQKFTDTIEHNPEYGPVPFPPRLILAKKGQLERLNREIALGRQFLNPAKAS